MALTQAQLKCLAQQRSDVVQAYTSQGWSAGNLLGMFQNWWTLNRASVGDESARFATLEDYANWKCGGTQQGQLPPPSGTGTSTGDIGSGLLTQSFWTALLKEPIVIAGGAALLYLLLRRS